MKAHVGNDHISWRAPCLYLQQFTKTGDVVTFGVVGEGKVTEGDQQQPAEERDRKRDESDDRAPARVGQP